MTASAFTDILRFRGPQNHPGGVILLGDNFDALRWLQGSAPDVEPVDLCYIDPPYATGSRFISRDDAAAYDDVWPSDEAFLAFLRERVELIHALLSDRGSLYLHIDCRIGPYVRVMLDEIFGKDNFRSEITRIKCNPKNFSRKAYGNVKDVIYFYSKKSRVRGKDPLIWNDYRLPLTREEIERQFPKVGEDGRRYTTVALHAKGETADGPTGRSWRGILPPKGRHWACTPEELDRLDAEGRIHWSSTGNPRKILWADEHPGNKVQDVWEFKDPGYRADRYPTEKNQAMLDLIVRQSSLPESVVMDCFMGSGTTLAAAAAAGRAFIGMDQSPVAFVVAVERLAGKAPLRILTSTPAVFQRPWPGVERVGERGVRIREQGAAIAWVAAVDSGEARMLSRDGDLWLTSRGVRLMIADRHGQIGSAWI
jgi:adenine-specific DNA-methyltransferase